MKLVIEIDPRNDYEIIDAIEMLKSLPEFRDRDKEPDDLPSLTEGRNGERLTAAVARVTETAPAPTPAVTGPSEQDAVTALMAFVKEKGHAAAVALLTEFGVARCTELKPEQRAAFVARTQSTGTTVENAQ